MALSAGSRLGGYEILAPVGAGGMGEVYRARDARLGRDVALKVISPAVADDPDRRFHPVISPDGRWLALALTDGVTTNIWMMATADGAMRPLTDFGHRPTFISRRVTWSPEGRYIYAAVSEGEADIVLLQGLMSRQR